MNIQMELTNHCNLSCVECPHRFMERSHEYMSDTVFRAIYDKLLNNEMWKRKIQTVILHKDGEPLLHPWYMQYLSVICQANPAYKIDTYTNGLLLEPSLIDEINDRVLKNKLWFLISFHFYNASGKFNDYSKAEENIKYFIEHAPSNVEVVLATHVTDFVEFDFLHEWQNKWKVYALEHKALRAVHVNTAINPWAGRINQSNAITFPACPYADGEHFFIGVTGKVIACCMDLEEEIVFGHILHDDLQEILQRRKSFYSCVQRGAITEEICHKCLTEITTSGD